MQGSLARFVCFPVLLVSTLWSFCIDPLCSLLVEFCCLFILPGYRPANGDPGRDCQLQHLGQGAETHLQLLKRRQRTMGKMWGSNGWRKDPMNGKGGREGENAVCPSLHKLPWWFIEMSPAGF